MSVSVPCMSLALANLYNYAVAVHITSTNIFVTAVENCCYTIRTPEGIEVTSVVNVGRNPAVGDIKGTKLRSLHPKHILVIDCTVDTLTIFTSPFSQKNHWNFR